LKTRKETATELIVYIPSTLPDVLHDSLLSFLEPLGMDTREWNPSVDVIKFVRKVIAEWDDEGSIFRPCEEYRKDEDWIIHYLKADKFLDLVVFDPTGLLWGYHLGAVQNVLPGKKIIVILEGLGSLFAKAKTARNRAYDSTVRGTQGRAHKDDRLRSLDDKELEKVEKKLIEMQVEHEIRLVHTTSPADSAEWISIFATDISSIPYR
jgi:crossover junction endonuclease EME1